MSIQGDQDPNVIHCRARITTQCSDGCRESGWREDGTYQRNDDSICCTACYVALGCPHQRYVNAAINAYWSR